MTEIQRFKNVKINKEMYGHLDTVWGRTASEWPYISSQILTFSNGCILLTSDSIFVKLGLHFMTMWINSC